MPQKELCVTDRSVPAGSAFLESQVLLKYSPQSTRPLVFCLPLLFVWGSLASNGINRTACLAQLVSKLISVVQKHLRSRDFSIPSVFSRQVRVAFCSRAVKSLDGDLQNNQCNPVIEVTPALTQASKTSLSLQREVQNQSILDLLIYERDTAFQWCHAKQESALCDAKLKLRLMCEVPLCFSLVSLNLSNIILH